LKGLIILPENQISPKFGYIERNTNIAILQICKNITRFFRGWYGRPDTDILFCNL